MADLPKGILLGCGSPMMDIHAVVDKVFNLFTSRNKNSRNRFIMKMTILKNCHQVFLIFLFLLKYLNILLFKLVFFLLVEISRSMGTSRKQCHSLRRF